jgi:FdhD protein
MHYSANDAEHLASYSVWNLSWISMMQSAADIYQPVMSNEGLMPAHAVVATNEFGDSVDVHVPGELPLTIRVDGMEVVTLMTLGTKPEALTLGYIRNQKLIEDIEHIKSVAVDWDQEVVDVTTHAGTGIADWQETHCHQWMRARHDF